MAEDLRRRIEGGELLLLDGAMGTQLAAGGLEPGGHNNCEAPEAVLAVHRSYVEAGCHGLLTNTLTMNRIYVESHGLDLDVVKANIAGARLARQAAGQECVVLGDMSSTGQMLEPYGTFKTAQFEEAYREQAEALLEGGVDGIIIETVFDLGEALCALRAVRKVTDLPVIVTLAFTTVKDGGRTIMGNSALDAIKACADEGADAFGANCGELGPDEVAQIIESLRTAYPNIPLCAQPNAGKPQTTGGETFYTMSPEDFAAGLEAIVAAGARIVGGCCGTTPEHMKAAAKALLQ